MPGLRRGHVNLPTKRLRHIQVVAVALLSIAGMVNYLDRSSLALSALIYLLVVKDRPSTTERRKSSSIQYSH